ncbi:MAG: pilus assembly FimT family protein, partial [Planctomycetota bacterium]
MSRAGVCPSRRYSAFTLAESMVVIVLLSLFVAMAVVSFGGALRRNTFKGQAQGLVSAMQMAASAAAESDRRYEVIIDPTEQSYLL